MKAIIRFLSTIFVFLLFTSIHGQSIVEKYGKLHTSGNKIVSENNTIVRLAGMSMYWTNTNWGGDKFYTTSVVNNLVDKIHCNVIRVAMGVGEGGGLTEDSAANKAKVRTVVNACINKGIYVIICFHSEEAYNFKSQAISFFKEMAQIYGQYPNIIYEINNEPGNVDWNSKVKPYADEVIDSIRTIDPDNLIIVGTTSWSKDVDIAANNKIDDSNVAYAFHFFPGGSYSLSTYSARIDAALAKNIPIFATEWGMAANTDDVDSWINFMKARDISICNWCVNDNDGIYALMKPGTSTTGAWFDNNISEPGMYVKNIISTYSVDNISFNNLSSTIESKSSYTVSVIYNATAQREIHVGLYGSDQTLLGSGMQVVEAGAGYATIPVTMTNAPAAGSGYKWRCDIRELSGDISTALDMKDISNVIVETGIKIILHQKMAIIEGQEDGKSFDVLLLNNSFVSDLSSSNWIVENLPAGVSVDTIERKEDNLVTVVLKGNSSIGTYSSNILNLTVTVLKEDLQSSPEDISVNTGIVLSKAYSFLPETYTDGTYKRVNYGFYVPESHDPNKKYPLVMYLHGFGSIQPVYLKFYDSEIQAANPCFVYTPRTDAYENAGQWYDTWSNWWSTLTEQMTSTLEQLDILIQKYPSIDTNRIYVYGISMGGEGVFDLLDKCPTRFAAAISICGGGRDWWAPNISKTPFWMFHGGADNINPPNLTEDVYDELVSIGAKKMRYKNYPGMGHEIWNTAQSEPSFYDWMFAFSKADTNYLKPTKKPELSGTINGSNAVLSWDNIRVANDKANKIWYYNIYNNDGIIGTTEFDKTNFTFAASSQPDTIWVEAVNYNFQKSASSNKLILKDGQFVTSISDEVDNVAVTIRTLNDRLIISSQNEASPLKVQVFTTDGALLTTKRNSCSPVTIKTSSIDSSFVVLKIFVDNAVISRKIGVR